MAKKEIIYDDLTGQELSYPHVQLHAARLYTREGHYEWLTLPDPVAFKDGTTAGKWLQERIEDVTSYQQSHYKQNNLMVD